MISVFIKSKYYRLLGIFAFIMYSLSYFIGYEEETNNHLLILVKIGLITLSGLLFLAMCWTETDERYRISYSFLGIAIFLHHILLMIAVGRTIIYIRDYPAVINSVVWSLAAIICIIRFRKELILYFNRLIDDRNTVTLCIESFAVALVVIVLSMEPNGVRFSWDSDTLYGFLYNLEFDSLYDTKQLIFSGHMSNVYVYVFVLFKLLFGNIRVAAAVLTSLSILAASFGMTFLIRAIMPGKSNMLYTLADAVFCLSPWVCGMSTYHIYDHYIICLYPLLLYYCIKKNWTGFFVIGIMITFSKTPAVIVFGAVCIGLVICDLCKHRKIYELIKDTKYWYFLSVAFVFLVTYILGTDRSRQFRFNDTAWGFDAGHISQIIKIYLTANFLWILVLLSLLLFVGIAVRKIRITQDQKDAFIVIITAECLFVLFNAVCVTYTNPRYMDSHIVFLFLCSSILLISIKKQLVGYVISLLLIVIMVAGSFRTIDPVSGVLFNSVNVGDHKVTCYAKGEDLTFGDSYIYNRDYYSYEIVLNKVLTYIFADISENDEIMMSLGDQSITWGLSGGRYSYGAGDGKIYFDEFYDKSIDGLANGYDYEYFDSEDMIPFKMHYIFGNERVSQAVSISDAGKFYYIYMPTINSGRENEIFECFKVINEEAFDYRGWKMNCIVFRR